MTLSFKPEGTVLSRLLCEEISKRSDGICILAFSRGKDSIPAWIWLKEFFHTIYVYHLGPAPNMGYTERSLKYYEKVFETPILRWIDGEVLENISLKSFQLIENYELIDQLNLPKEYYSYHEMADIVREKYNCPKAWHAMALLANDNIFRRMNLQKKTKQGEMTFDGGIPDNRHMTFYPTFDWTLNQNLEAITKNGIWLPDDYAMIRRTMSSAFSPHSLEALMECAPEDFEATQAMFPLIKAVWARNQFRRMNVPCNGVAKKRVSEVLKDYRIKQLEQELADAKGNPNKRKS